MLETIKKKYLNRMRQEMKQEFLKEAEREFDREFSQQFEKPTRAKKKPSKKKTRAKKVMKGHTKAEDFIPAVTAFLKRNNGRASKKDIAQHILLSGTLTDVDVQTHSDGKYRFYKTLDRTRKIMVEADDLSTNNRSGIWELQQKQTVLF